ncbi:MAG TPA: twin-arginine translocase subunit TatC [Candidatus Saccharimonadales bacterium]|nr:twin-arginine translocase subunit TatC [Candidatus Saccharimonadales bacterium]
MLKRKKNQAHRATTAPHKPNDQKLPFIEHIHELRQRLFYVAASVVVFGTAGYFIQQQLVRWLLKPSKGQQFIYTTPTGGLNFLFEVCIYFGITLSIPVFIYQVLRYIEPLIHHHTKRLVLRFSLVSWLLALGGAAFGYYLGLPVALNFLSHQFTTSQIKPLLTIQEYMSFVTIYLLGSALLFQVPLILLFINRIRPIPPRKLLGFERYFIAIAFIAAAIMTPTPDVFNQALFAGPIIVVYQLSILLIYLKNRRPKRRAETAQAAKPDLSSLPPNPFMTNERPVRPAAPKPTVLAKPQPLRPRGAIYYQPRPLPNVSRRPATGVWDIA